MVLTRDELISTLQNEVRILVHLAGKVDPAQLDYRPTPKQRTTLELLQYMAVMGPTQLLVIKTGVYDRPTLSALWTPAMAAANAMSFDQTIAAIQAQSALFASSLYEWSDADFREEINMFGSKFTRAALLMNQVICGFAAYRMQLFCYLKSCGREELNTVNLWAGVDQMPPPV